MSAKWEWVGKGSVVSARGAAADMCKPVYVDVPGPLQPPL